MSNYPLNQSSSIFLEIANKYKQEPITNHDAVESFFTELQEQLGGLVILDFLDTSNWDRIEKFSLDRKTGILTLTWHDYRDRPESVQDKEIRQMAFPASLYSCALHVNSIVPIVGKSLAIFIINGYAKTEKEIKNHYKTSDDELKLLDNSFFEKRVIRRASGEFELIDFHCTPIYSMAIVPKKSGLSSHHSKQLLYYYNFREALTRLNSTLIALDTIDEKDFDSIAEKVNTVRRIMEFVLKVECCSRELKLNKGYSHILLGDLIKKVKSMKDLHIQLLLGKFAELANEFSHDSGRPIDISKAKFVVLLAVMYTTPLEIEYRLECGS